MAVISFQGLTPSIRVSTKPGQVHEYTQFCEHYRRSKQKPALALRQEHRAGEKVFADWAGQTVPIVDRHTGEVTFASIFVAVLGASNYT